LEKGSCISQNPFPVRDEDVMTGAINLIYSGLRNALAEEFSLGFGKRLPHLENLIKRRPRFLISDVVTRDKLRWSLVNHIDGEHLRTD